MWKAVDKNLVSYIGLILVYLAICIWAFELLLILGAFIKNAKYKDIYIFSIVVLICLVFVFLLRRSFYNDKPKYKDWKYVWKDWRIYEWDWDKKYWANWKWKLTWADGSYYEWEFKNGNLYWKWKKVLPNWERYEWDWENNQANWKWKTIWVDGSYYEWEFKNWKPHWMWIIKMKNWYYYEWEFSDWKRIWKFKKQILTSWWIIEWEFRDNWNDGFDWIWKVITSDWFTFEWIFKDWKLNWEWKTTFPDWSVCVWNYVNWELKNWKKILKNWEYSDWNWINWGLNWLARYYFKDGSYYEWECRQWNWDWVWTYITKKWDKYSTEFPYEIINIFMYWFKSKIKEIQWNLNYIPMNEKEKQEEKNMDLEILEKWTNIQKEIIKLSLDVDEKIEILYKSFNDNCDSSWGILEYHKNMLKLQKESRKSLKKIADKNHIKCSKSASYNSYWRYFYELDCLFTIGIEISEFYVKFDKFLYSNNILDFIVKREEKNKEWVYLIDEFSERYKVYVQVCLDWREYEKKFWNHNFKPGKKKK